MGLLTLAGPADCRPWRSSLIRAAYSKSALFGVGLKLKLGIPADLLAASGAGVAFVSAGVAGFGVTAGAVAGELLADLVAAFGVGGVGAAGAALMNRWTCRRNVS